MASLTGLEGSTSLTGPRGSVGSAVSEGVGARVVSVAKSVEAIAKRVVGRAKPVADVGQGVADGA